MSLYPAGLTPDSIDVNFASSSSPPPMQYDQWSAADTDDEADIQEVTQQDEDLTVTADKIAAPDKTLHIQTDSPANLNPPAVPENGFEQDASSVHSMPVVQVTEPTSPTPMSARNSTSRFGSTPGSNLAPPSPATAQVRRNNRLSMLDARASNRLSGFFSSLIHRRDPALAPSSEASTPTTPKAASSSRASSPVPSRPTTPPPQLPAPSLIDLGLTLSSLTAHLSPSSSSHPPSSGAFLGPHYLLLCHVQGLDVLPLIGPPSPQPYALIRRVPFKSVVVMEHRGVLVAIAGRRDGVRVYALEEIKRAVEWRMEAEVRREQERARRELAKRSQVTYSGLGHHDGEKRGSTEKDMRGKTPVTPVSGKNSAPWTSGSVPPVPHLGRPKPPARTATVKAPKAKPKTPARPTTPTGPPPAYNTPATPRARDPPVAPVTRSRATSISEVMAGTMNRHHTLDNPIQVDEDAKADWASSDDEAINVVAAPSGSQMLDERTSSMAATTASTAGSRPTLDMGRVQSAPSIQTRTTRRSRPSNLDLTITRTNTVTNVVPVPPPSPTPTLLSLQQALTLPPSMGTLSTLSSVGNTAPNADADVDADIEADEDDDGDMEPASPSTPTRERISLAEALLESRLPDLPPVGTRRPQQPILLDAREDEVPASPRTSESTYTGQSLGEQPTGRRRRRWSVLGGVFTHIPGNSQSSIPSLPESTALGGSSSVAEDQPTEMRERTTSQLTRSNSTRIVQSSSTVSVRPPSRPSTSPGPSGTSERSAAALVGDLPPLPSARIPSASTRFLPRIITNAFQARRSDDTPILPRASEGDVKRTVAGPIPPHAPAPKLEYVKLPGTKGAVMVKAVETAKKSFLAILCGENGEKVELFAGTYRTALGLSRTFILPDSPRSLELQLQGDDLVEVFLVFSQNVFGLEPATVRVREVRIGRAERRAARRRARENRIDQADQNLDADAEGSGAGDDDTAVNVTIVAPSTPVTEEGVVGGPPQIPSTPTSAHPSNTSQHQLDSSSTACNSTDELTAVAAAQSSPYTTFQQLSFAPKFPLATIADDYVIPPTYPSFLEYRSEYEPEVNGSSNVDLSQVQFSPPGLPVPIPAPPSKWFYRDPKGVVHGPWKSTLMQAWYKDGLLPPDLPVRREEDTEYMLLKDLRLQCVDPSHPFRSSPPLPSPSQSVLVPDAAKPLLSPISLLSQPKHFGPPALFYSSRGGHSTTIVDARGRSVLKGRFLWSPDDSEEQHAWIAKLGDVKRLEAFDVRDRAVLVAMRQGGLEAVDFGDALLRPADHSRTVYPHFQPASSSINRREPFVWKIGSPLSSQSSSSSLSSLPALTKPSHRKKQSTGPAKPPGRSDFSHSADVDSFLQDEVLFLGRKNDELYICERRTGSFRILRLSVNPS
ncbi:hypothetical protein SCP_0112110 [Sparassis crispa]|uniref:GYF domain-containing protein n=1 Tax=Sparassis crispa TaxID=139825 RepID=A0A401G822_9APHY|nr:hypothetical protein SCP_0112110 [Sparassis crispa]GBE78326.1 hypothetical protein SCP_0112110 [Sparassis crispa]